MVIYSLFKSIIEDNIRVTNVYSILPVHLSYPYVIIKSVKNIDWRNFLKSGVKSLISCEIYTQEIDSKNMLSMIKGIKNSIVDNELLLDHPDVIYVNFDNYKIRQDGLVLVGAVYFNVLVLD